MHQKTVAFDLDGTLLEYKEGMAEKNEFGLPFPGIVSEIKKLRKNGWKIIIWTCRKNNKELHQHLKKYDIPYDDININSDITGESPKIYADVYVDDKALSFKGNAKNLAKTIMDFKPWHKQ